jgi:hypothetical protein
MRASLGQPVIIENVGGAAGTIGVARAVRAAPDGLTVNVGPGRFYCARLYMRPALEMRACCGPFAIADRGICATHRCILRVVHRRAAKAAHLTCVDVGLGFN